MIDLIAAAAAAKLLNEAVSSVDKVYGWFRALKKEAGPSVVLKSDPASQVLEYVTTDPTPRPVRVVMTYGELARRLSEDDANYIDSMAKRMKRAMAQWEALNERLPLLDPVERARVEANMLDMKDRDICPCLGQVVGFIDQLGIDLQDHYMSVRTICAA
jgi:hypothetical protein